MEPHNKPQHFSSKRKKKTAALQVCDAPAPALRFGEMPSATVHALRLRRIRACSMPCELLFKKLSPAVTDIQESYPY